MSVRDVATEAIWRGEASCGTCVIRELALFADLSVAELAAERTHAEDMSLPAGAMLYRAERQAGAVFTVREGLLKLEQYLGDGTRRIVRLGMPGDLLGLEAMVAEHYEHSAIALQPTRVCRIPRATLGTLSQQLSRQLMNKWHESVRRADAVVRELATGHARQRVARLFLMLGPPEMHSCRLFGRDDVGALLGITTETASRTIAAFKRERVVHERSLNVFERDVTALTRIAMGGVQGA